MDTYKKLFMLLPVIAICIGCSTAYDSRRNVDMGTINMPPPANYQRGPIIQQEYQEQEPVPQPFRMGDLPGPEEFIVNEPRQQPPPVQMYNAPPPRQMYAQPPRQEYAPDPVYIQPERPTAIKSYPPGNYYKTPAPQPVVDPNINRRLGVLEKKVNSLQDSTGNLKAIIKEKWSTDAGGTGFNSGKTQLSQNQINWLNDKINRQKNNLITITQIVGYSDDPQPISIAKAKERLDAVDKFLTANGITTYKIIFGGPVSSFNNNRRVELIWTIR
jgi:hypothetical protein